MKYGPRHDKRALSAAQYRKACKFDLVNLRAKLSTGHTAVMALLEYIITVGYSVE